MTRGVEKATQLTIAQARARVSGVPSAVIVFVVPEESFAAPKGVSNGSVVAGSGLTKDAKATAEVRSRSATSRFAWRR